MIQTGGGCCFRFSFCDFLSWKVAESRAINGADPIALGIQNSLGALRELPAEAFYIAGGLDVLADGTQTRPKLLWSGSLIPLAFDRGSQ